MIDLTGQKFTRLLVLKRAGKDKGGNALWLCRCDCGVEKIIYGLSLKCGETKSCGCWKRDLTRKRSLGRPSPRRLPHGEAAVNSTIGRIRRRAKKRGLEWSLSKEEVRKLMENNCSYCGTPPSNYAKRFKGNGNFTYSGLDRVDNRKGYTCDNVVPCCKQCNTSKGNLTRSDFLGWVEKINKHNLLEHR